MAELLVAADVEVAALAELSAAFPELGWAELTTEQGTVGTKIPSTKNLPSRFVRVVATGGGDRDLVTGSPTFVLEGFANDEQDARDLCAMGAAIVKRAARAGSLGGVACYRASATQPANLPHPDVPRHFRYTSTISVDLRMVTV